MESTKSNGAQRYKQEANELIEEKRLALSVETRTRFRAIPCIITHQIMHSVLHMS